MVTLTHAVEAYFITVAICGFFYVGLAINVIRNRNRAQVAIGHGDDYQLHIAIRAFGNFSEYTPITLILVGGNLALGAHMDVIFPACLLFLMARILHIFSLYHFEQTELPTVFYRLVAIGTNILVICFSSTILFLELMLNAYNPIF
jgi:uncharacterized membrane protein YecN with MAPEG domain